ALRPDESMPLRLARTLDMLCGYFSSRGLIKSYADLRWLLGSLAVGLIPFTLLLSIESATGRNPFAIVGGNTRTWFRDGAVRSFGSFRHPSLVGPVGATFFPLFVGLAFDPNHRKRAILGAGLCITIVYFSSSGGPLCALLTGFVGWALWRFRTSMR